MTTDAALSVSPKRRVARWLWALLILSLALNLLVIGVVGGSLWAVRRGGYWDAPLFMERAHRLMRGLSDERRTAVRAIFAQYRPQLQPSRGALRQARVELGRLLARDHSPQELDAALADMLAKEARARDAARPMIAAVLNALKPEERLHFLAVYMPYLNEMQGRPDGAAP
jgi:uncharacterized membrane protein